MVEFRDDEHLDCVPLVVYDTFQQVPHCRLYVAIIDRQADARLIHRRHHDPTIDRKGIYSRTFYYRTRFITILKYVNNVCQFTCMCDQWLRFARPHVRPSTLPMAQNYHDRFVALSVCPYFCAKIQTDNLNSRSILHRFGSLTWKTNSSEFAGMATCCVSAILPETAIQTLADVIVGPFFFDGKITTRYGSSANEKWNQKRNIIHVQLKIKWRERHPQLVLTGRRVSVCKAKIVDCVQR